MYTRVHLNSTLCGGGGGTAVVCVCDAWGTAAEYMYICVCVYNTKAHSRIKQGRGTLKPRLHVLIWITLNQIGMRVSAVHTRNHKLD